MKDLQNSKLHTGLMIGSFASIWFVWGSTFLAGRIAVETIPPILLAALRSLAAGSFLYAVLRLLGNRERIAWRPAFIAGTLLFLGGHGLLAVGLRTVPSGASALVEGTIPLWILLFHWRFGDAERPSRRETSGIALALLGIVALSAPWEIVRGGALDPLGTGILLVSAMAWGAGTVYARQSAALPPSPLSTSAMLLAGGSTSFVLSLALGEVGSITAGTFTLRSVSALIYLVLFGSLLGFAAYTWLLGQTSPARVSSYAYVNPVVAVLLGWALAGEELSARMLLATLVTVAGVVLVVMPRRVREPSTPIPRRGEGALQPETQGATS